MIWLILGGLWLIGMAWLFWEIVHAPERPEWDPEYWRVSRTKRIIRSLFAWQFYWPRYGYEVRFRPDGRAVFKKVRFRG